MAWHNVNDLSALFYGKDVLVLARFHDTEKCVVTFTSRGEEADIPLNPFGAGIFEREKTSYVAVIALSNHWWCSDEFKPAMERINTYLSEKNIETVISYGGSMGGVGAIHSSQYIAYHRGVVFGAQYDISPSVVPWDNRWHDDAICNDISLEIGVKNAAKDVPFLYLYDPFSLDKKHVDLLSQHLNISPVPLAFSGHELFRTLNEVGLAGDTVKQLVLSDAPPQNIQKRYRALRSGSPRFWTNLKLHAVTRKKHALDIYAEKKLHETGRQSLPALHRLAHDQLVEKKDAKESELLYDQAVQLMPDHAASWRGKAKCQQAIGNFPLATSFALGALARGAKSADLHRVLMETCFKSDALKLLSLVAKRYLDLFPENHDEDFYKRFSAPAADHMKRLTAQDMKRFEDVLTLIRTRRPQRYTQLYQILLSRSPKSIIEVGVFDGETARQMINLAQLASQTPDIPVSYYGFDLFEDMTAEINAAELSKRPLSKEEIRNKLTPTGAEVTLIQGDTVHTLQQFAADSEEGERTFDFTFLDGGHSKETIENDWHNISSLLSSKSLVVFDDYYVDRPSEIKDFGCNELIERLSADPRYNVQLQPLTDTFEKEYGVLRVAMVFVTLNA